MAFDSGGTRLAIAERWVPDPFALFIHSSQQLATRRKLYLFSGVLDERGDEAEIPIVDKGQRRGIRHNIGPMTWGRGITADYIYASTEPEDDEDFTGFHKAFDATVAKAAYTLDAEGAGDAIAMTNDGMNTLANSRDPANPRLI
jgi:hypothetical protein